jgi:hypothetical protein
MWMTIALDPDGAPRAWGRARNARDSAERCREELITYRRAKREVGDPLGTANYTYKSIRLTAEQCQTYGTKIDTGHATVDTAAK